MFEIINIQVPKLFFYYYYKVAFFGCLTTNSTTRYLLPVAERVLFARERRIQLFVKLKLQFTVAAGVALHVHRATAGVGNIDGGGCRIAFITGLRAAALHLGPESGVMYCSLCSWEESAVRAEDVNSSGPVQILTQVVDASLSPDSRVS